MKRLLLIGAILAAVGVAVAYCAFRDRGTLSAETIKEIEAQIVMPEGSYPLATYLRFYSHGWKGWKPAVVGVFMWQHPAVDTFIKLGPGDAPVQGVPGAYTMREVPEVYDGGCYVVTVYYDESVKQLLPIERDGKQHVAVCNGN